MRCSVCLWKLGLGYDRISRLLVIVKKDNIAEYIGRRKKRGSLQERPTIQKLYPPSFSKPKPTTDRVARILRRIQNKKQLRKTKFLRRVVWSWLFKFKKSPTAEALVGCTRPQFKSFIASKFSKTMSWDNYASVWELDHIIPCSKFDLSNPLEVRRCFHFSNYQPLLLSQNRRKYTKLTHPQQSLLL